MVRASEPCDRMKAPLRWLGPKKRGEGREGKKRTQARDYSA
jgi:hypothetical protein